MVPCAENRVGLSVSPIKHVHHNVILVFVSNTRADIQNLDTALLGLDVKSFKLKTEAVGSAETTWFHNQERLSSTPEDLLPRAQSCVYPCVRAGKRMYVHSGRFELVMAVHAASIFRAEE
jgi:hypothetical protein